MRLFLASLIAETNTFCTIPTGRGAFEEQGICRQIDDLGDLMGMRPALAAAQEFAKSAGWDVAQGLCTAAQPLGRVVEAVYQEFRSAILSDLAAAMPVDAVVLVLHGAMTSEACDDCEGDLLGAIRALVGPEVPIGVSLDLHCHFTAAMRAATPIHVAYKEYPHTDIIETALTATKLAIAAREEAIVPQLGFARCPIIGVWPTTTSPLREFVQELRQLESKPGVLSVSLGHGMAYGDVPEAGACVWVVADGNVELAKSHAEHLATEFYRIRHEISATFTSLNEALDQLANWQDPRPLALADFADNPGGGAMGDSTFILKGIIERGIGGVALGGIWDPGAVQLCFDAGVGAKFLMRIGGKTGPASGMPIDVTAQVMALVPDHSQDDFGTRANVGPSAWVRTEQGIDVALISVRQQVLGLDLFTGLGINLVGRRGIVVKSMQHFLAAFDPVVGSTLLVDTPGLLSTDFANIPFKHRDFVFWPREKCIASDLTPISHPAITRVLK
jgi:microcystin degradation protein MlrC